MNKGSRKTAFLFDKMQKMVYNNIESYFMAFIVDVRPCKKDDLNELYYKTA